MTYREMTAGEKYRLYKERQMPCGHGKEFFEGPSGGMATNIKCAHCDLTLNVDLYSSDMGFGQVLEEPADYVPPELPWHLRLEAAAKEAVQMPTETEVPSFWRRVWQFFTRRG